jgi:SynChlorMet cassette protein ScmA
MKYEKPALKDLLGYEAEGADCQSGSTASPNCGNGGHVDDTCYSGSSANGNCEGGTGARGSECREGTSAANNCFWTGNNAVLGDCVPGMSHSTYFCSQGNNTGSGCGYGYAAYPVCDSGGGPS